MDKNMILKLNAIKERAKSIKSDPTLRHIPNHSDIAKCSENTRYMQVYQGETIKYRGRDRYD